MRRVSRARGRGGRRWMIWSSLFFFGAIVLAVQRPIVPLVSGAQADDETMIVDLAERNGSGVTAQAELARSDAETRIRVSVLIGDGTFLPFLHRGTCAEYGAMDAVPLSLVAPEAPSETTVDLDVTTLTSGTYVIDLHVANGNLEMLMDPETGVACGVIETGGARSAGIAAQAPVTGIGPVDLPNTWSQPAMLTLIAAGTFTAFAAVRTGRLTKSPQPELIDVVAMHRLRGLFL
jgi:hypothetical protein